MISLRQGGLRVLGGLGAGLAVPVGHDETRRLMPPVKHQHQQQVPHLVAGAQVVELTCRNTPVLVRGSEREPLHTHNTHIHTHTSGAALVNTTNPKHLTWEVAFRNL